MKKSFQLLLAGILAMTLTGCARPKNNDKMASLPAQQPDRLLFDRSTRFFAQKKYEQAITTLQVLMNTYPDSQYAERAKLALEDCWRLPECAVGATELAKGGEGLTFPGSAATGTSEGLCDALGTVEIRLDNTPAPIILHVFRSTIARQGIEEPMDATATACDPDRTCDRNLKARVQFKHFNRKNASGSYVIERSDGRKQVGSFEVRAKPVNRCE